MIATLATQAETAGFDVLICTGDRDAFQLISDHVTVIYPMRGVSEMKRMTPEAVFERYGVQPARYPDLAAMVGESSDNLPGVPGVGPRPRRSGSTSSATSMRSSRVSTRSAARRVTRCASIADVIRNRRINRLVRDLQLPLQPADLAQQPWDRDAVHRVFDGLEFRVLRDRLFETLSADEPWSRRGRSSMRGDSAPARSSAGLPSMRRVTRSPESTSMGSGSVAPGGSRPWAGVPGRVAAWVDATEIGPDDEVALAPGWQTLTARRRCTTRRGRCWRWRRRAGRCEAGRRHGPVGVPVAPRPAVLRPR